ncbi:hypothetical protein BX616_006992 [Lobosporangium transversale]|uniref:Thioredoxin domain-containing protein n=1 Tax=Lobosporangium transversale TaxID=64571 RepID=A0A1Y2GYL1_9FUNG|nr:hypothetical protein BCR41DRAFT_392682 [Lobosporangium transversale]KAF9896663.1 hypothetical protein BX616_006992 [Lobosporangium transversale]ORZ27356.1 hypothetical protein BCR41DRAFT_392682 [Lobosporangium transversale]|eukprot:XP_021885083.1 hypothetical protein BCR41DRAFT_392682 [Lobosporangium transversale]
MSRITVIKDEAEYRGFFSVPYERFIAVEFTRGKPSSKMLDCSTLYHKVIFLQVDVDEQSGIAQGAGVTAVPTIHFYKNDEKLNEVPNADPKKLKDTLSQHFGSKIR